MDAPTLFKDVDLSETPREQAPQGPFAAVALEQSIDRTLDYSIPQSVLPLIQPGQRVRLPLGRNNRPAYGYVISIHESTTYPRIKKLFKIDDDRVLISPRLMELARWMSRYYCSPLGVVLDTILPSAVRRKVGLGYTQIVRPKSSREEIQTLLENTKATKRRAILARLLQVPADGFIELIRLANEAGVKAPTVRKLAGLGVITITSQVDLPGLTEHMANSPGDEQPIALNDDQQKVYDEMLPRVSGGAFSVNLLLGVTGSGKTEVYLQCIREVVKQGRQAIVLVPEIALTPQTVRRFTARFQSVAILHSGLTATQRHRFWQQIATGQAQVIVGARSAVFAPAPNLGIIVVDEEHEASYKQDTAPRYNGRDIAIKRAQLEGIPVLLGSATPSLETYWKVSGKGIEGERGRGGAGERGGKSQWEGEKVSPSIEEIRSSTFHSLAAQSASMPPSSISPSPPLPLSPSSSAPSPVYTLLTLPKRVRGLEMPHVELIDMKMEGKFRRGVHLLSQRLEHLLRTTLQAGHQAILLLNRRGYSNFVYCSSCQEAIQCNYCDTTMTYHRSRDVEARGATLAEGLHTGQLHCHYCLAVNPLPAKCPTCGKLLSLFGLGTQRVEEEITRKFPELKFARVDSDSMNSLKDYEALLGRFAKGEIQVMLGTQMIAKGLDYPNVTLVGVISGDTALALPDFRSAERTFQLITQVAGRAGRGDSAGRVVLQTFLPDDPSIQFAIKQDFVGFAKQELVHRRDVGLPPFARMVRIVIRDQDQQKLHKYSQELATVFVEAIAAEGNRVAMKGPMPCPISRIAGYHRNQLVMIAQTPSALQRVLNRAREKKALRKSDRVAVDVDPVSLL